MWNSSAMKLLYTYFLNTLPTDYFFIRLLVSVALFRLFKIERDLQQSNFLKSSKKHWYGLDVKITFDSPNWVSLLYCGQNPAAKPGESKTTTRRRVNNTNNKTSFISMIMHLECTSWWCNCLLWCTAVKLVGIWWLQKRWRAFSTQQLPKYIGGSTSPLSASTVSDFVFSKPTT